MLMLILSLFHALALECSSNDGALTAPSQTVSSSSATAYLAERVLEQIASRDLDLQMCRRHVRLHSEQDEYAVLLVYCTDMCTCITTSIRNVS